MSKGVLSQINKNKENKKLQYDLVKMKLLEKTKESPHVYKAHTLKQHVDDDHHPWSLHTNNFDKCLWLLYLSWFSSL